MRPQCQHRQVQLNKYISDQQKGLLVSITAIIVCAILLIGAIFFLFLRNRSKKKALGIIVFILGFIPLWIVGVNLAPYFFSKISVLGEVKSVDCSGDIQNYSIKNHYPDCNYKIAYNLNGKSQTTTINSISSAIVLSQGQQVAVNYSDNNSNNNTVSVNEVGSNKNFFVFLFSHYAVFFYLLGATMFFYSGFKLMGLVSTKTDNSVNQSLKDRLI